jgi:hypothetical protein
MLLGNQSAICTCGFIHPGAISAVGDGMHQEMSFYSEFCEEASCVCTCADLGPENQLQGCSSGQAEQQAEVTIGVQECTDGNEAEACETPEELEAIIGKCPRLA